MHFLWIIIDLDDKEFILSALARATEEAEENSSGLISKHITSANLHKMLVNKIQFIYKYE